MTNLSLKPIPDDENSILPLEDKKKKKCAIRRRRWSLWIGVGVLLLLGCCIFPIYIVYVVQINPYPEASWIEYSARYRPSTVVYRCVPPAREDGWGYQYEVIRWTADDVATVQAHYSQYFDDEFEALAIPYTGSLFDLDDFDHWDWEDLRVWCKWGNDKVGDTQQTMNNLPHTGTLIHITVRVVRYELDLCQLHSQYCE
ncbi:MAG: hypothetical protein ACOYL5_16880 [Phototrophicaceae bacterium]|jgi:hypothetical protein